MYHRWCFKTSTFDVVTLTNTLIHRLPLLLVTTSIQLILLQHRSEIVFAEDEMIEYFDTQ